MIVYKWFSVQLRVQPHFYKIHVKRNTLLVSRSEYPRDNPFLLTIFSYSKKMKKS